MPPGAPFPKFASHLARCSNFYRLATASWQEKPASPVRKPHCLIAKKASGKATTTGRGIGGFPQPRFTFPYKRLPPAASLQLSFCRTVYILFYFIPTDSLSLSCSRRLDDIHSRSISVLVFCFCFFSLVRECGFPAAFSSASSSLLHTPLSRRNWLAGGATGRGGVHRLAKTAKTAAKSLITVSLKFILIKFLLEWKLSFLI